MRLIPDASPFGLDNTVTAGIVSAKGRDTGDYLPFIQTDVAVNPGRDPAEQFQAEFKSDLLGGMVVLHHTGAVYERGSSGKTLYSRYGRESRSRKVPLTFIPYYAWANRQATSMQVWNLLLQA